MAAASGQPVTTDAVLTEVSNGLLGNAANLQTRVSSYAFWPDMSDEALLIILLTLPFAGSVAAVVLSSRARDAAAWVAGTTSLIALAVTASFYGRMNSGEVVRLKIPWVPAAGLDFTLR